MIPSILLRTPALFLLVCAALAGAQSGAKDAMPAFQAHREVNVMLKRAVPNLIVSDVERSHKFYRDLLEFETVQTVPPDKPPFIFVDLKRNGVEIFLNARPPEGPLAKAPLAGGISLYIEVEGIDDLARGLENHGVKLSIPLHTEFYGMREFGINDPDGYLLIFAERVK